MAKVLLLALALAWSVTTETVQQPSFRSGAVGVRVDVLVTEGRKPVTGLTAQDFELRDNGVPQTIQLVDAHDIPLNVVLALDTSASTTGKRHADLMAASSALLDELREGDQAALTTFSHAVTPLLAPTTDLAAVRGKLQTITTAGRTAVMDAVHVALTQTIAQPGRSLVVVCTDGSDVSSWLRPEDVVESARRSSAVVYGVATSNGRHVAPLEEVAEATGGDVLVESSEDLRDAFRRIVQDFRSRYILAYTPEGVDTAGFHRLDVRVRRRGLNVKARPGYIGGAK
jgi:Ca-activated chloride channel family protein